MKKARETKGCSPGPAGGTGPGLRNPTTKYQWGMCSCTKNSNYAAFFLGVDFALHLRLRSGGHPGPAQLREGAQSPPSLPGAPPPAINSLEFTGAFTSCWPCPAFQGLNANHMQSAHRPPRTPGDWLLRAGNGLSEENSTQAPATRALGGEHTGSGYADLHALLCAPAPLEPPAALTTTRPKLGICST